MSDNNDPLGLRVSQDNDPLGIRGAADPLGIRTAQPQESAGIGTGIASSFAGVGNTVDTAWTAFAARLAQTLGSEEEAAKVMQGLAERRKSREEWANPEGKPLDFWDKLAGTGATLLWQIPTAGLSPADTTYRAMEAGETQSKARTAGMIDAAGNLLGMAPLGTTLGTVGKTLLSGGMNAAQEAATKQAISMYLDTEKGKEQFKPTVEDTAVAGLVGAGTGAAHGIYSSKMMKNEKVKLDAAERALKAKLEAATKAAETTQREARRKAKSPQVDGTEPIYVDPQGQAFRGSPQEPGAYLGQERASDAYMRAMDENNYGKEGEPLPQLQKGEFSTPDAEVHARNELLRRAAEGEGNTITPTNAELHDQSILQRLQELNAPEEPTRPQMPSGLEPQNNGPRPNGQGMQPSGTGVSNRPVMRHGSWRHKQGGAIDLDLLTLGLSRLFHGGKEIKKWNPNTVGKGEGMAALGPGLYASDQAPHAELYKKYGTDIDFNEQGDVVTTPGVLNEMAVDTSRIINIKELSNHPGFVNAIEILDRLGFKASQRGLVVAMNEAQKWGYGDAARKALVDSGIDGLKTHLKGYGDEIVIFNKNIIAQISRADTPVEKFTGGWPLENPQGANPLDRGPGKNQRGGVLPSMLDPREWVKGKSEEPSNLENLKKNPVADIIRQRKKDSSITPDPDVNEVLTQARTERDNTGVGSDAPGWRGRVGDVKKSITRSNTYTESGYLLAAKKRNSTLIKAVGDWVTNAGKRGEDHERQYVFPAEQEVKRLSMEEVHGLSKLLQLEQTHKNTLTPKELGESGFSLGQIKSYMKYREMMDAAYEVQNQARIAQGEKPITKLDYYMSSRWNGDFKLPVHDKDGKLVWYLAADTKWSVRDQAEALKRQFPDLVVDYAQLDKPTKYRNRKTDFEDAYPTILRLLGDNDPAVAAIKEYMDQNTIQQGKNYLNQEKHFENKAGVRGFVGDRPGVNPKKDAIQFFEQQIRYARNSFQWAERQQVVDKIKAVINDPELVKNQPDNIHYAKEYVKHSLGFGESEVTRNLGDLWMKAGISPNYLKETVGSVKNYFILDKLAVNAGYTIANLIQTSSVIPYLQLLNSRDGIKGNPITAVSTGITMGTLMGAGHYANYFGIKKNQIPGQDFFNAAYKYAEENGVTSRSIYDEAPVSSSFSPMGKLAAGAGKTMTSPETFVRSFAFMTYAKYLKDSGKFKTDAEIFKMAEDLTHSSMVDYRSTERPMVFAKFGAFGDMLNTLQTYSMNYFNNLSMFSREALKGNPLPFLTFAGIQFMTAGLMGLPVMEPAYNIYMWLKNHALSTKAWVNVRKNEFLDDPKLWTIDQLGKTKLNDWINNGIEFVTNRPGNYNLGNAVVSGPVSEGSGVAMQSRLAAANPGQMIQTPLAPFIDLGKKAHSVGQAAMDPSNPTKFAQAIMDMTPTGLQGAVETSDMMRNQTYVDKQAPNGEKYRTYGKNTDLEANQGIYNRYPERQVRAFGVPTTDEQLRRWTGLRTTNEQMRRDLGHTNSDVVHQVNERAREVTKDFMDAMKNGDRQKMAELERLHVALTDKPIDKASIESAIKKKNLDEITKAKIGATTVQKIIEMGRIDSILEKNK